MKIAAIAMGAYAVLVLLFETMVVVMGARQAASGKAPEAPFVAIETTDENGTRESVVAAVEVDGALFVSANHWPRSWYHRALKNPEVAVTRDGERGSYLAVPVEGDQRARVAREYSLPLAIRVLSGFPPRAFLRLDRR